MVAARKVTVRDLILAVAGLKYSKRRRIAKRLELVYDDESVDGLRGLDLMVTRARERGKMAELAEAVERAKARK